MPYIEKQNGNIYATQHKFEDAIRHYNKSLFGMKMLFEQNNSPIQDQETAVRYIQEIEIPSCLNLALCYLKVKEYHYAIKYCTQVIEKEQDNDKALYRRGLAYLHLGELNKAKTDLMRAYELTEGKDVNVVTALSLLKEKQELQKKKEIEMSQKMINNTKGTTSQNQSQSQSQSA